MLLLLTLLTLLCVLKARKTMKTIINETDILVTENGKTVGRLEFILKEKQMNIIHTVAYERGKGIGSLLMQAAVEYAQKRNYTINPTCSFAKKYLEGKQ